MRLTKAGERQALKVIRCHRLIELLLNRILGYAWDEVHQEAEQIEHAVSPMFVERLAEALGNPDLDPHSDPIPDQDGALPSSELAPMTALMAGQGGTIVQVRQQKPEALRSLARLGLVPGQEITVLEHNLLTDTVTIKIGKKTEVISMCMAGAIAVKT